MTHHLVGEAQIRKSQICNLSEMHRPLPDSNRGWRICNPLPVGHKVKEAKGVTETPLETLAQTLARNPQIDPDLAHVMDIWPTLPPYLKLAILALANTGCPSSP
jgi:hypothetical protein